MKFNNCILFVLFMLSFGVNIYAQYPTVSWAYNIPNIPLSSSTTYDIQKNSDGEMIITGFIGGTQMDLDPDPNNTFYTPTGFSVTQIFRKIDSTGNLLWAKSLMANAHYPIRVDVDKSDNILLWGSFENTFDLNPSTTEDSIAVSTGLSNGYIIKLDENGDFIWGFPLHGFHIGPFDLDTDEDNNIFFSFKFTGTIDLDPGPDSSLHTAQYVDQNVIVKYDENGQLLWSHVTNDTLGGNFVSQLSPLPNGDLFVTGIFAGYADMDPGPSILMDSSVGYWTNYMQLFDPDGNLKWYKTFESAGAVSVIEAETDPDGNIYFGGTYESFISFDSAGVIVTEISNGASTAMLVKLDSLGNLKWVNSLETTYQSSVSDLEIDDYDGVLISGGFTGGVDFDPGPDQKTELGWGMNSNDGYVVRFNRNSGEYSWHGTIRSYYGCYVRGIESIDINSCVLSGSFLNQMDISPGPNDNFLDAHNQGNWSDFYELKWHISDELLSTNQYTSENQLKLNIYPNPVNEFLFLSLEGEAEINEVWVFNNVGQLILQQNSIDLGINTSELERGLYWVQLKTSKGMLRTKFMKQ